MAGLFGGSKGGGQAPKQADPIDYSKLMAQATEAAKAQYRDQLQAQIEAYPRLERLQLGTVSRLRNNLNNAYTQQAKAVIDTTLQQGASALADTGNRINALGDLSGAIARDAQGRAMAGANSIEQGLYDRAAAELALGSALNPEEERIASQQASNAYAMRGLGTGAGAATADLLNRYQYGQARLQQRLGNAQAANQTREQGIQGRQNTAQGLLGNTANLYGQAGGAYQNASQLAFGGANALVNLDPYQRALGIGVNLGSGIQGQTGQMIGNTYNQAGQMAGNVASFNANMLDSRYNSYQNNQAAQNAASTAANGQLLGAGIGAVGSIGGTVGLGIAL